MAWSPSRSYVLSEGRYRPQNFPEAQLDESKLLWDTVQPRSNYQELSASTMAAEGGRTWLTEYANRATTQGPASPNDGTLFSAYYGTCSGRRRTVSVDQDAGAGDLDAGAGDDAGPTEAGAPDDGVHVPSSVCRSTVGNVHTPSSGSASSRPSRSRCVIESRPGTSRAARATEASMQAYLQLLRTILEDGKDRADRTGTGTRGIFGHQMRFDLRKGFPLLTTKKLHVKSILHELLWFVRGETHVKPLQDAGVRIWNEWATPEQTARFGRSEGDLGPVYGHQWRNFGATRRDDGTYEKDGVDQLRRVLHDIQEKPSSRRLIVTGWNPKEADEVALPPCHTLFQLHVQDGELSCQLYQRSADVFLGVPFNIASYAMLTMMIAHVSGLRPGDFVHTFGDAHLYTNHLEQAALQLTRAPRPLPRMTIDAAAKDLFTMRFEDFAFEGYDPHPHIKAEVSV